MKVLTIGTFDLLHAGHLAMLERAAEIGELMVGVNSDGFVTAYKGSPYEPYSIRAGHVSCLPYVSRVVENDGPGADLIRELRPSVLAIGPDWMPPRDYLGQIGLSSDELFGLDVVLAFVPPPRTPGLASSVIRESIGGW